MSTPGFDQFAESYDVDLQRALSSSGEGKEYFAQGRVAWTLKKLNDLGVQPKSVLDFGCGTGTAASFLQKAGIADYFGIDVSSKSIEVAQKTAPELKHCFQTLDAFNKAGEFDLAYTNGVFHHIPPAERLQSARLIWNAVRPGGYFAFWENNPWNPGTKYVMSNCVFDRDAITLTPPESRKLLRQAGFKVLQTDFLFIFPRRFKWFRRLEPALSSWPIGGQYLVLCCHQPSQ